MKRNQRYWQMKGDQGHKRGKKVQRLVIKVKSKKSSHTRRAQGKVRSISTI